MPDRADIAVAKWLADNVPDLTLGGKDGNLFHGPIRPTEKLAVFCQKDGGLAPVKCGGSLDGILQPQVQIFTRGDRQKFDEGQDLVDKIRDAIHLAPLPGFIDVQVIESEPNYLGETNDGQPEWSQNLQLKVDKTVDGPLT